MVTTTLKPATNIPPGSMQIGNWRFDASTHRLENEQEQIKLEPRVAQLLLCLAENENTAVSRNLLMDRVWPGMVVGDEALTNAINKLRKAFGDDRQNPQIIETIPKVGYRLIAPVRHIQPVTPEQQARLTELGYRHMRKGMPNEGELLEAVNQLLEHTRS